MEGGIPGGLRGPAAGLKPGLCVVGRVCRACVSGVCVCVSVRACVCERACVQQQHRPGGCPGGAPCGGEEAGGFGVRTALIARRFRHCMHSASPSSSSSSSFLSSSTGWPRAACMLGVCVCVLCCVVLSCVFLCCVCVSVRACVCERACVQQQHRPGGCPGGAPCGGEEAGGFGVRTALIARRFRHCMHSASPSSSSSSSFLSSSTGWPRAACMLGVCVCVLCCVVLSCVFLCCVVLCCVVLCCVVLCVVCVHCVCVCVCVCV